MSLPFEVGIDKEEKQYQAFKSLLDLLSDNGYEYQVMSEFDESTILLIKHPMEMET